MKELDKQLFTLDTIKKPEKLKFYIMAGADVDAVNAFGLTALLLASTYGYTRSAEILIEAGADLNFQEHVHGWTALLLASKLNHIDIVKLLVEAGADVTLKNNRNRNAILLARWKSHEDVVELLKQQGATYD